MSPKAEQNAPTAARPDAVSTASNADKRPERPATKPLKRASIAAIPEPMREVPHWVCWRFAWRAASSGQGKWTKIPVEPRLRGGKFRNASSSDPEGWGTLEEVFAFYSSHRERNDEDRIDGIGLQFGVDPCGFVGIDFDNCIDGGVLAPWAAGWIEKLGPSYAEVSPSGKGLKVFYRGALPAKPGQGPNATGRNRRGQFGENVEGACEAYDNRRYFTVTCDAWGKG